MVKKNSRKLTSLLSYIRNLITEKTHVSISLKLVIAIGSLILIGGLIAWYIVYYASKKDMIDTTIKETTTYMNIIQKSLHHNMLQNQIGAIEKTIEIIGSTKGIKKLRILDLQGNIKFSSDSAEIGSSISSDSALCNQCHRTRGETKQWIIAKDPEGERFLKMLIPIKNEKSCYTAPCHNHPKDVRINGLLEVDHSLSPIQKRITERNLAAATFGIICLVLMTITLFVILWRIIIKPISSLSEGMEMVSKGNLDYSVKINTKDEIGMLAHTFNSMTKEIKSSREKLENWAKTLEEEVAKKTEEIRRAQQQYIHTEKLAALGRMAAGVAHELNSPLTGIVTFSHLLLNRTPPENKTASEDLKVIIEQAERCSRIVTGLLGFSRSMPAEKGVVDVNRTIEYAHNIVRNQSKFYDIKIVKDLQSALPKIKGDASQIEQVFLNLLINSADAMDDKGNIIIKTREIDREGDNYIEIEFTDTGPGIPDEYMSRVFEPFFTTKPVGKGTGLGLSVSHGIIQKHGGHIMVSSKPGLGTSFFVLLPIVKDQMKK